ncbi:MAG: ATP-binding protein, partial [Solirubrobacteraceae bacterium]
MIGRTGERELLAGLIRSTARGQGAIGVVEGAPGIGKTTLLRAWVEQAREAGLQVRQAVGRELEQGRPFGLMISALDVFGTSADPEQKAAAELLSRPIRDSSSAAFGFDDLRYATVDALAAIVERMALTGPAALVIDDLQWCDASSMIVLDRAFRLTAELPLAVVCASRPHPRSGELAALLRTPEAARAIHVGLGPLDGHAVEELVQSIIGADPGPSVMRQALRCGGDPLFITELITGLAREGMLHRSDRALDLIRDLGSSPPPTISILVLRHLSMLPTTSIDVLLIAAVLGSRFSVRDLAIAASRSASELLRELRHAVDAGLLVEDADDMAFQHDLVRDAIYDDIGPASRRALHRQIAEALATDGAPARKVALHFAAGSEGKDPVAAEWLLRAGRETAPRDPVAAIALLRHAVELADDALAADRIRVTLAQALAAAGQLRDAESLLRSLIDRSPDPAVEAEARAALGEVLHLRALFSAAADELARAARSPTLPETLRARLFAHSLMDRVWSGGPIDTDEANDPRAALAEARRVGDRLAEFYSIMTQERIAQDKGSLREAVRFAREAGRIASAVGPDNEITHHEMPPVAVLIEADLFDEALEILRSAPAWNDDRGGAVQPQRHFQLMRCHLALGEWDGALAEGETGLRLAEESGTVWSIDATRAQLALVAARRDELERAETLLRAI